MSDINLDEAIRKSISEESVDDILAEIINKDGSFNSEFNGLFARYLGVPQTDDEVGSVDLSDRSGESELGIQVEYEAPDAASPSKESVDAAIMRKMGDNSGAYSKQVNAARRPNFTSGGDVRYPAIGSGASEERVVYDVDWEAKAREEADRARRYSDRSPYNQQRPERAFVAGGRDLARESYRPKIEQSSSPFVDPISDDDDFDRYWARQYEQNQKKSFFQEGPRTNQAKNKGAGAGDRTYYKRNPKKEKNNFSTGSSDWLQVDNSHRNKRGKNDRSAIPDMSPLPKTVRNENLNSTRVITEKNPAVQRTYITGAEIEARQTELETQELKNTVAQIVDKYDRKTQEELLEKAKADKLRLEKEKEEAAREALEKAKKAKKRLGVSENVCDALDEEDKHQGASELFDDFSEDADSDFEDI